MGTDSARCTADSSNLAMDEMSRRWYMQVDADLPAVDRFDLSMEGNLTNPCKRQFAAEYSQKSYESLIEKECIIGDYVNIKKSRFKVSEDARSHMVTLIDELTRLKEYK